MGGLFSKPKTEKIPDAPTPEEAEGTSRTKAQLKAGRIKEQDTLLSSGEERAKLLG